MIERIQELWEQSTGASVPEEGFYSSASKYNIEKFAELLVEATLTQVAERAYYTGDRDWSDELDRPWIQLEFGYGPLADAQKGIFK